MMEDFFSSFGAAFFFFFLAAALTSLLSNSVFFSSFGAAFFFFFFAAAERSAFGAVPSMEAARTGVRLVVPRKLSAAMVAIILRILMSLSVVQFEAVENSRAGRPRRMACPPT